MNAAQNRGTGGRRLSRILDDAARSKKKRPPYTGKAPANALNSQQIRARGERRTGDNAKAEAAAGRTVTESRSAPAAAVMRPWH
jgi:hypothetical protein